MKKYLLLLLSILIAQPSFAMDTLARQAIVVDDATNTVLFEKNADERMYPSSMTKLMTVYIVFSRLKDGSLKLTDTLPVSQKAWEVQGSKTFVELGSRMPIDALLQGIIVQSGNDACMVVAEGLAGSQEGFAAQMNDMAKKLGLTNSHFVNPHGLSENEHYMSARDLAILAHHVIHDFPEYYHYFSQKDFTWHKITQGNRNLLLYKDLGVDGLKTGHTDEGGFGIVVSGKNAEGRREIIVINGLNDENSRAEEAERLLAFAFRDFDTVTLLHKGDMVDKAKVWFGEQEEVGIAADKDIVMTLPKVGRDKMKFTISYMAAVPAPIKAGDHIADLQIEIPSEPSVTIPLVAKDDVTKLHGFKRMWHTLMYYVNGSK